MNMVRILLITAVFLITAAVAAEAGVSVTPGRHIVRLKPGESRTVEYKIENTGAQDLDVEVDPKEWTTTGVDVKSFLSLREDKLIVKAESSSALEVTLTSPGGIDGEIVIMLFLCYKEDVESILNVRNGIPLYFISDGTERYGAEIESIKVAPNRDPVTNIAVNIKVEAMVKNTGNIHIEPDLRMSIKDSAGDVVRESESEKTHIILRDSVYALSLDVPIDDLADGNYTLVANLSYQDKIEGVERAAAFEILKDVPKTQKEDGS